MIQKFCANDTSKISLISKLVKDCRCCATHGILEIHRICQVDGKGNTIDYEVKPFTEQMISFAFFLVPRQQHQHNIKYVGIYNG